jgi:hypothetical protein
MPWANRVDYSLSTGTFYVQDIYAGPGLAGVPRGTIRKLRVVALDFRAAGVGENHSSGPAGGALASTPISIGNGAWDVKAVLGEAKVYEDGSAMFIAPARKPLYFQALDDRGCAVQTMRSWVTLQPGEYAACIGCHEHKNTAPPARDYGFSLAMKAGPQPLEPFYGAPRGFSFPNEIQPILDALCIRCHKDRQAIQALARGEAHRPLLETPLPHATGGDGSKDELAFSYSLRPFRPRLLPALSKATTKVAWLIGSAPNPCRHPCPPTLPAPPRAHCCPCSKEATRAPNSPVKIWTRSRAG